MPLGLRKYFWVLLVFLPNATRAASDTGLSLWTPDSLRWSEGLIRLHGGRITIQLPKGFRYLNPRAATYVLEELWGNPHGVSTLGMIFGPGQNPLRDTSWGVVLSYEEYGHVDDKDASCLDYEDLLKTLRSQAEASNAQRVQTGFAKVQLLGWAERPTYDSRSKTLVWAKELDFGNPERTLNYSVRMLGRTGVLNLNAVSPLRSLGDVKAGMTALTAATEFTRGNRYADYEPTSDRMAGIGLGALVAEVAGSAKTATQIDFFQWFTATIPLGKFWLFLVAIAGVALGVFWRYRKHPKEDEALVHTPLPNPETSKS